MSESMKNILEKGHVYAVQIQDGRIRSAKVTTKNKQMFLHSLQDGEPPIHAQTIKVEYLFHYYFNTLRMSPEPESGSRKF